ncbi:MAG: MarR family winged helix-turn-helix transcriptional regulator [Flammeovirgaceae bacterium]
MEVDKLTDLIKHFACYAKDSQEQDLEDFAFWLLKKLETERLDGEEEQINRDLGYYVNRINRYGKYLSKHFLEETAISSLDEFSFLTTIKALQKPSKSEVYEATITELTTGQQMMRRLVKMGLVAEEIDSEDKRMKRVVLTEKGIQTQNLAFKKIGEECNLKFETLNLSYKQELLRTLKVLDKHLNGVLREI